MIRKLPSNFLMAPIAEITNAAFRKTLRKFTSSVILHSEMLSAGSVLRGGFKNAHMTLRNASDEPFVYQLLGNDPRDMAAACAFLTETNDCLGVDINMGCSAPDIVKKDCGSKLLHVENYTLCRDIISRCRSALKNRNLSVKLRTGYPDYNAEHLFKLCRMFEAEGVDYVTLHGRSGNQAFRRTADWNIVKLLAGELKIPVIGNGDVHSPENAFKRLTETSCGGIMIGRMAVQEPWIFALCEIEEQITVDLLLIAEELILELEKTLPCEYHKSRMHRFLAYYYKNLKFGHSAFSKIRSASTASEMIHALNEYFICNPHERNATFLKSGKRIS